MKTYSKVLIALLKGIVYNSQEEVWNLLLQPEIEHDVRNYFADIRLELILDKAEGYAYLKQQHTHTEAEEKAAESTATDDENLSLIRRRQLTFAVSLLCLLLRKYLIESDQEGSSIKAIVSRQEIESQMRLYLKESTNEAKITTQIQQTLNKVIDLGFLRRMNSETEQYEVNRIIKAFVNAEQVSDWLERYREYTQPSKR